MMFPAASFTKATTTVPEVKSLNVQQFAKLLPVYAAVVVYSLTKKDVAVTPNCELADASELN